MRKADYVRAIADRLGVQAPAMSTGSKEPKRILQLVNRELGLGFDDERLTKPQLAAAICNVADVDWDSATCEARGNTIQREGLRRVLESVDQLTS
jgi:hypothetical protein